MSDARYCDRCKKKIGSWEAGTRYRHVDPDDNDYGYGSPFDFCNKCNSEFKKWKKRKASQ